MEVDNMSGSKKEKRLEYKDAGVDTREGGRAVDLMRPHVKKTFNKNVLADIGSFGSIFKLDTSGMKEPVLISGADGVGTKLKVAFLMDKHDTIGIDCVAMCVNDILCHGAKPLFFLDYIATGRVEAEKVALIVKGVAEGCAQAGCALIGGETSEMPGIYQDGEYDIAGFAVGICDRKKVITGEKIAAGDKIIGIASSGLHSNGFALARKVFFEKMNMSPEDNVRALDMTLGEALLAPTRIYADACQAAIDNHEIKGIAHITGGGFFENIPRILPKGLGVTINMLSWQRSPIFSLIQECGDIGRTEMFKTFNMGIGMVMAVAPAQADDLLETLRGVGEDAEIIGEVNPGHSVSLG